MKIKNFTKIEESQKLINESTATEISEVAINENDELGNESERDFDFEEEL